MYINYRCKKISNYLQYDFLGEIYASGAERVGRYKFPQLKATKTLPSGDIISFNYMLSSLNLDKSWFHFYRF